MKNRFRWLKYVPPVLVAGTASAQFAPLPHSDLQKAVYQYWAQTRDFNLVSFGNFTRSSGGQDVQGAAVIGGTMTLGGSFSFMNSPGTATKGFGGTGGTGDPDLIVYGGISISGGSLDQIILNGGTAAINLAGSSPAATWNSADRRVTQGSSTISLLNQGATSPQTLYSSWIDSSNAWNLSTAQSRLNSASVTLKGVTNQNVTSSGGSNQLNLSVGSGQIGVWNVNQSALAAINEIALNVPSDSLLVINVHGAAGASFPNSNSIGNTQTSATRVLWNITGAAAGGNEAAQPDFAYSLGNGGGTVWGSFLAPKANIDAQKVVEGQVVAASWTQGNVELHTELFQPSLALVPEPSVVASVAGLSAFACALLRRRRAVTAS